MNQIISPEEFKHLRDQCGLSQAKIARDLGLKRSYISQFENSRYQFSEAELLELKSYLKDYFNEFQEEETVDSISTEHPGQNGPEKNTDLDECVKNICEILAMPVPKMLFVFDDDEGIERIRALLLQECLTLVQIYAETRGHPIGGWDDERTIASRVYE
jgi:transcriptional regulator with XRE-family HTH domain